MQFLSCGLPDHRGGQPVKPEPRRWQRYPLERPHAGAGPDRAPRTAHRPRRDRFVPPARRPISASQTPPTLSGPLRARRPTGFGRSYFRRESPSLSTPVDKPSSHVWTLESALSTRVNRRGGTASRHFEGMGVSAVGVSRGRAQACRQAASVGEFAARQTALGKAPLARSRKPRPHTAHSGRRSRRLVSPYRDMRSRSPGKRSYL